MNRKRLAAIGMAAVAAYLFTNTPRIYKVFLPLVIQQADFHVGAESESPIAKQTWIDGMIVKVSCKHSDIEKIQGVYDWSICDNKIGVKDMPLYLSLKMTTHWANGNQPVCKLPLPEHYADWARWANAAIDRYNPRWVEIWNEPDAGLAMEYLFGCLGSTYEAGYSYGEFYNYVYASIEAEHPNVTVIAGALMMNTEHSGEFVRGFLASVDQYDGFSFHCYPYYIPDNTNLGLFNQQVDILLSYGINKPLYLSETSVVCKDNCGDDFENVKAEHARRVLSQRRTKAVIWYTICGNGWMHTDLCGSKAWNVFEEYFSK